MNAITPYGKAVRKLRIEADVTLREMAQELGYTPTYLSAVEIGRKALGEKVLQESRRFFERRGIDASSLQEGADRTRSQVDVSQLNEEYREFFAAFARKAQGRGDLSDVPAIVSELVQRRRR